MDFAVTARPWSDAMGRARFRFDPLRNALVFARALRLLMIAAFARASGLAAAGGRRHAEADDRGRAQRAGRHRRRAEVRRSHAPPTSRACARKTTRSPRSCKRSSPISRRAWRLRASASPNSSPQAKDTAATADSATDELKAEQAKHDTLDADLRSARALLLQTDEDAGRIGAMRRDLFARQTFARSSSVLSPWLWTGLAREMPGISRQSAISSRTGREGSNSALPKEKRSASPR